MLYFESHFFSGQILIQKLDIVIQYLFHSDVLVDPLLFNIHDDELAQNAEAVWLLNNLNESPER